MKLIIILVLAGIILSVSSCQKQYESSPLGQVTTASNVFNTQDSNGVAALQYLSTCYGQTLLNGNNRVSGDYLDAASDDAVSNSLTVSAVQQIATGAYTAATPNADDEWTHCYFGIRDVTLFIDNIYQVPMKAKLASGKPAIAAYRSEARFLRAWLYMELVKRYGGVPLLGDSVFTITTSTNIPRNSFSDCINYIVSECNNIQDSLMAVSDMTGANYGHVTRGAAMALKAEAWLLAASPLYNGGNIGAGNPLTGYTDYQLGRWDSAAQSALAIINSGIYSLMPDFRNVFITQAQPVGTNTESICWYMNGTDESVEQNNSPIGYSSAGAKGNTAPTQNLVNAFPTDSGYAITASNSGYDANNPYSNRDPRLLYTVFCNGASLWLNRAVQTFDGGLDKPGGAVVQTKTGYYMRKFMGLFETAQGSPPEFSATVHDWIYYRYAGILLDYAEATNEYSGPSTAVYNVLFQIRARAGIPAGTNSYYGLAMNMSQTDMRTAIQNERRCEMAFEERRYWDIRRWKIAAAAYNTAPLQGVDIVEGGAGAVTYNPINVLTTAFNSPTMYLYPIPYSETIKDPSMTQNPGW
jgi:hypothetical protein